MFFYIMTAYVTPVGTDLQTVVDSETASSKSIKEFAIFGLTEIWPKTGQRDPPKRTSPASFLGQPTHRKLSVGITSRSLWPFWEILVASGTDYRLSSAEIQARASRAHVLGFRKELSSPFLA
jgi:hypothetical protein